MSINTLLSNTTILDELTLSNLGNYQATIFNGTLNNQPFVIPPSKFMYQIKNTTGAPIQIYFTVVMSNQADDYDVFIYPQVQRVFPVGLVGSVQGLSFTLATGKSFAFYRGISQLDDMTIYFNYLANSQIAYPALTPQ
jgi:hypothetical protein